MRRTHSDCFRDLQERRCLLSVTKEEDRRSTILREIAHLEEEYRQLSNKRVA